MLKWIHSIHITFRISKTFKRFIDFSFLVFVLGSVFFSTGLQAFASTNLGPYDYYQDESVIVNISNRSWAFQSLGDLNEYRFSFRFHVNIKCREWDEDYKIKGVASAVLNFSIATYLEEWTAFSVDSIICEYGQFRYTLTDTITQPGQNQWYYKKNLTGYFIIDDFEDEEINYDVTINFLVSRRIVNNATSNFFLVDFIPNDYYTTEYFYKIYAPEVTLINILREQNIQNRDLLNLLENDSSNISDNVNTAASSAAAAELAADTAISSALPSADTQLDSIADYDYNSIATNNTTALSFWKSLGDWLLSNSNLVGIGALLIGCLFIGFVVYLLRL